MPPTESNLLRLAAIAHQAAADPSLWPEFLRGYAESTQADITILQKHHFERHESTLLTTFGMTSRFKDSYNQQYSRINSWRENGRHLYVAGRVLRDEQFYPRGLLKRTEFYNDYLVKNHGTRCLTAVVFVGSSEAYTLTALRDEPKQPFDSQEDGVASQILPHVMLARATQARLEMLAAAELILHRLRIGIVVLAKDKRVLYCNESAERILRENDGLTQRSGHLVVSDSPANKALQHTLQQIVDVRTVTTAKSVVIPRRSGRRPYSVTATPLSRVPALFVGMQTPTMFVSITDPDTEHPIAPDVLKEAFGLTRQETFLAIALSEGHSLEATAERLGIRYETARTHLRRIFSKTHTSRQAELILLLNRLSPTATLRSEQE